MAKKREQLSKKIREKIISAFENGNSSQKIAEIFDCNRVTVDRIIAAYITEGRVEAKPRGGCRPKTLTTEHEKAIRKYISQDCSITLERIVQRLFEDFGIVIAKSTVDRRIDEFNFTIKRVRRLPEKRNDKDVIEKRFIYAHEFLSLIPQEDGTNIFFVDEVGFYASMRSKSGRSPRGQRAVQVVPNLRTRNISICCAISKQGTFFHKKQSFPFNKESFNQYILELLEKFEEKGLKNVILIMDNVRFHRNVEVQEKITASGHYIKFLPPYSPFLNPIENLFSQLKQIVRSGNPKNEDELINLIDSTFLKISTDHCANYYRYMLKMIKKCLEREHIFDE
jgi:transposase